MKYIIFLLSFVVCGSTLAYTNPTEEDRQAALALMYAEEHSQDLHFIETSSYESTTPKIKDGLIFHSCAYSTFAGKGYKVLVHKIENGKVWNIERHTGEDNAIRNATKTSWTCMNCNGESYDYTQNVNEHGLCAL